MIDDIVLKAIPLGQRKEDAYNNLIKKVFNKQPLAHIHEELPYKIEEIYQVTWIPKENSKGKLSSTSYDFILARPA